MYSQSYGAQSPDLSNNPFLNDPSNPHTRFPDISSTISPGPGPSSPQYGSYAHAQPQMIAQNTYGAGMGMSTSMSPPPQQPGQQFQPSSGFGQQLVAQVNATGYGQVPGQMQLQPQATAYPGQAQYQNSYQTGYPGQQIQQQQPQMQYANTGYPAQQSQQQYGGGLQQGYGQPQMQQPTGYQDVAQFDPYGPIAQGWGEGSQNQNQGQGQNPGQTSTTSPSTTTYNGHPHPREYIRTHKAELESWDSYSWKQCLSAFDTLKDAWSTRKKDVETRMIVVQRDYGYTGQQEIDRLRGIMKEAESNSDSVAASSYQMHEVFQGYRQSGDLASKRRVREATNAALNQLPDWPSQNY